MSDLKEWCNKCIHFDPCKYYPAINKAFEPFISPQFGGRSPDWDLVDEVIIKLCPYYEVR